MNSDDFILYILNNDGKPCGPPVQPRVTNNGSPVQYRDETDLTGFNRVVNTTLPFDDFGFHDINNDGQTCGAPQRPTPPTPSACFILNVLPDGTAGVAYTATLGTERLPPEGEALQYSITAGALPDGLTLDRNTGVISGTPTEGGTYTIMATLYHAPTVTVMCSQTFTLTIAYPAVSGVFIPDNSVGAVGTFPTNPRCCVVVGGFAYVTSSAGTGGFWRTADGSSWTKISTFAFNGTQPARIIHDGNQFIAVHENSGNGGIFTSPDGVTWTDRSANIAWATPLASQSKYITDVAFDGVSKYIAVTLGSNVLGSPFYLTSTDGAVTWQAAQLLSSNLLNGGTIIHTLSGWVSGCSGLAFGGQKLVAATSLDGSNWTPRYVTATTVLSSTGLIYQSDLGIYVNLNNNGFWQTSSDAANWTSQTRVVTNGNGGVNIAFGNKVFMTGFEIAPNNVYTSTDGINWTLLGTAPIGPHTGGCFYFKTGKFLILTTATTHL